MAEQQTYNPYTLTDIERYLTGKMSAAEMHALEKAALQDPFLSDAIEGYGQQAPNFTLAHEHLNYITASLSAEKQQAKVIAMPVKNRNWFKTAAAAVVVVAAGITGLLLIKGPVTQDAKLAQQTATPVITTVPQTQPAAAEAKPTEKAGDIGSGRLSKQQSTSKAFEAPQTYTTDANATDKKASKDIVFNFSSNDDSGKKSTEGYASNFTVTSPDSAPSPRQDVVGTVNQVTAYKNRMANKSLTNNNLATNSTTGLNATLNSAPTSGPSFNQNMANVVVQKPVNMLTSPASPPPAANAPVLQQDDVVLNKKADTARNLIKDRVAGLAVTQDKENFAPPQAKNQNSGYKIVLTPLPNFDTVAITHLNNRSKTRKMLVDTSLLPNGGWENFRDYVVKRLNKKVDTTELEGDVELEFTVDDLGIARNITITKSLSLERDAQAAEMVKQWPGGWITSKKQKKGKVVIQF